MFDESMWISFNNILVNIINMIFINISINKTTLIMSRPLSNGADDSNVAARTIVGVIDSAAILLHEML